MLAPPRWARAPPPPFVLRFSIFLLSVTEPILGPIRNNIPLNSGGIDFSPIAAFFIIGFLKKVILFAV